MPRNMAWYCGQFVYSLRTTLWTTCVRSSTTLPGSALPGTSHGYNPLFIHTSIRMLSQDLSTAFLDKITPVFDTLIHDIHSTYNYLHEQKKGKRI